MIPTPMYYGVPPEFPNMGSFWEAENVRQHIRNLQNTIDLAKALYTELRVINEIRQSRQNNDASNQLSETSSESDAFLQICEMLKERRYSLDDQQALSLEAGHSIVSALKNQLSPLTAATNEASSWEHRSMAVKLSQKLQKAKRNKKWKKKKRKHVAELLRKEREGYDKADKDADEWRAREIAKDIAKRKVESMKKIAKLKAIEERKKLESELELVLVVEKLQELRSIRIQKLKKQGHFLPEEDDMFLERIRASVEEEERQAAVAIDIDAAKDAIATAKVSRTTNDICSDKGDDSLDIKNADKSSVTNVEKEPDSMQKPEGQTFASGSDSIRDLPYEFYHYYHGSNNDMGTLIEVRRTWDAYIRPGGSRIPGHWVQPPQPADEVWASYLVKPRN